MLMLPERPSAVRLCSGRRLARCGCGLRQIAWFAQAEGGGLQAAMLRSQDRAEHCRRDRVADGSETVAPHQGHRRRSAVTGEAAAQLCVPDQQIASITPHIGDIERRWRSPEEAAGVRQRPDCRIDHGEGDYSLGMAVRYGTDVCLRAIELRVDEALEKKTRVGIADADAVEV